MISYNDFAKLELKVGKIVSVDLVEGKDKLYLLKVDLGEEKPRQIVAGLRPYYKKEDLENKSVVVLANLEPKQLGNYVSEGMLLAADDPTSGKVALLMPDKEMPAGSKIY